MLNFNDDANNSYESEEAAAIILENLYNIKIDIVAADHKKYDLIVSEWNEKFPTWTTIDVKNNLNTDYNNFILESINIWRNANLSDNDKTWKSYFTDPWITINSYWRSFSENMVNTDYIFFLDTNWKTKEKWTRVWYLVHHNEIVRNNFEKGLINWKVQVTWNKVTIANNWRKWRSAFIFVNKDNFLGKIKVIF